MNHLRLLEFINERLQPLTVTNGKEDKEEAETVIQGIECRSFSRLTDLFKQEMHWTREIDQTLAVMLAVVFSTSTSGGQLGLRIRGPAGSAKSTLAECISKARKHVYPRSTFRGIVSGWHSVKKSQHMAAKMHGKNVMVKEADSLLQLPNLKQIESEIRDALGDGVIRAEYRTGRELEIETLFSMTLCGTNALLRMDNSILGSRFLDCAIQAPNANTRPVVQRAINSQIDHIVGHLSEEKKEEESYKMVVNKMAPYTVGFIDYTKDLMHQKVKAETFSQDQRDKIEALANYVAFSRARVEKEKGDLLYRPEKETGTRIGEQLARLAIFLSITYHGRITFSKTVFDTLRKVAFDTSEGFQGEIIRLLHKTPDGLSAEFLSRKLDLAQSHIWSLLKDMSSLKIVTNKSERNGTGRGRSVHNYHLTPELSHICEKALER